MSFVSVSAGSFVLRLEVDERNRLIQRQIGGFETDSLAFPAAGDGWVYEPALNVVHADGNTSTDLQVTGVETENGITKVSLKDPQYDFHLDLFFRPLPEYEAIETWTAVHHGEEGEVRLEAIASSTLDLGDGDIHLTQFCGDWADEANMVTERITPGVKVLDSKLGVRAHQFRAPWFLLSKGPLQEDTQEVVAGSLAWSGSFRFSFERLPKGSVRAIAGINPFGSTYHLKPGETFETPKMVWAWSDQGAGDVTRRLHRYVRQEVLRNGDRPRPILLNNWEATYFSFDEAKVISLFEGARDLGMELFLLDDGWFGEQYPRNDDTQGLGDWEPNSKKLPNGISPLTTAAKEKGLRFGLWFEPEMVNPRSSLFEAHPEWVIGQPKREMEVQRNQMALDLSNPEVCEFAFQVLNKTLTENPGISYVKWDCNRYLTQPGSRYLSTERQSHLQIDYVRGLYEVMERLRKAHPDVEVMMCSGGGGRVDYGALRFAHELWPSDMTDPVKRIFIQWGFSYFIPALATAAHVTRWNERPIKFAFDVAMSGRLGMDIDVDKLSEADREFSKRAIQTYKEIRDVVQFGDLYRLESPYEGPRAALSYVLGDRAVVFVYASEGAKAGPLRPRGLDPGRQYRVRELNRLDGDHELGCNSGERLMSAGIPLQEMLSFGSHIFELVAED